MLKCKDVTEKADALVDGTPLSWRERTALRVHLLMCHHCRRYVRQLRALVSSLRIAEPSPVSDDHVDKVLNDLDRKP
ncbi:MAG: zf-HC2 domain-containing protein [Alcanivorax sediminis]|uniref:Zf-HC2 domain-containing protein n=1 Tax=Alcanivorax sediminis TaxID=2663008 RepID=A0A6N7LR65_9GAMM|nr:zf-HC2 domain-containing protein [Alcanivorax sediminis]